MVNQNPKLLVDEASVASYYEATSGALKAPSQETWKLVSNWIMTELLRIRSEKKCEIHEVGVTPQQLASLIDVIADGTISSKTAKELFPDMLGSNKLAAEFIEERGLRQVSDVSVLKAMVEDVIRTNPDNLKKYREGKTNLLGFFVGQVLKASGGSANPSIVTELMKGALDAAE